MSAARAKAPPVGSSAWVQSERDAADVFVDQATEDFGFSVRNELEWLNEHMADIFSKSQVNFADMFKTPGKLRGKTPRTARKINNNDSLAPRQPLTDIFASNTTPAPATAVKTVSNIDIHDFQIAHDTESQAPQQKPIGRGTSPQRAGKSYTDSGYHGMMTEDEMDGVIPSQTQISTQPDSIETLSEVDEPRKVPLRENQPPAQRSRDGKGDDTGASDDSFVSAREQKSQDSDNVAPVIEEIEDAAPVDVQPEEMGNDVNVQTTAPIEDQTVQQTSTHGDAKPLEADHDNVVDIDMDAGTPQSDGSSPEKPFQRKSSFTFSSLPAREPLGAKKSMNQIDRHRSSVLSRSINKNIQADADEDELAQEKSPDARLHSKSSTQLLHERLNMLGKTREPRSSKSIPQSVLASQASYPQLPGAETADSQTTESFEFPASDSGVAAPPVEEDDDDWIAPVKPTEGAQLNPDLQQAATRGASPARPSIHQKSMSTTVVPSPSRPGLVSEAYHQKAISVSNFNLADIQDSTTPAGSPMAKRQNDGPLSASKSRLWSALKSAKNIFASSASTSAAAKLEAHNSPAPKATAKRDSDEMNKFNMPGALHSQDTVLPTSTRNGSVISFSPSRKTRNSAESDKRKEKELKAQQKAASELEKAREKERQKAAKQQAEEQAKAGKAEKAEAARLEKERNQVEKQADKQAAAPVERPESAGSEKASESEMPPPPPPKGNILPTGKLRAPGRLMRPARETVQSKPAPVSIRVASQSQRIGPAAQSTFSKSQHESSAPPPPPKDAVRVSSAQSNRGGPAQPGNARLKALEAAARRKEADERAAQKKAEQKRELERKRAEKVEQERRAEEERKAAEQQRIQEAKLAIQRRAIERQAAEARKREHDRLEQQRREQERFEQQRREQERSEQQRREAEQLRQQEDARKAKEAHDLAEAIRRERAQQIQAQGNTRADVPGTLRQLSKNTVPANPTKPAKRNFPAEDDEPTQQPQRPGIVRGPPSYQQTDAKRRRTNEEQEEPNQRNSVMAPPKRPSTLRKETMNKFSGYTHAPPPAAHHTSMYKATVTAQHQMQHVSRPAHPSQLVQTSNARIPFAENANPPASYNPVATQVYPGYENAHPSKFKTPARPATAPKSAKSTPHYPQGDNIELPDIATDSEDESDEEDGGFRAPSWVASPALRDLLTQQQLVDPETVFGPIGELKMDEVFKNSKNQERLKRFRDRGSSALWTESGDAVTSAEKRRDMEMRERVVREGGWRYEPNA